MANIRELCKGPVDRRFAGGTSWVKSPASVTKTYSVDEMKQSWQDCVDRTIITGVVQFT